MDRLLQEMNVHDYKYYRRVCGILKQIGISMLATYCRNSIQPAGAAAKRPCETFGKSSDLSANDFADEVATLLSRCPAIDPAAADRRDAAGGEVLAPLPARDAGVSVSARRRHVRGWCVADPSDVAAVRAAEIVLGGAGRDRGRLLRGHRDRARPSGSARTTKPRPDADEAATARADDDIESLRDLASGAPVVRAVNDLFESAMELRATDIHIEPFRTGLVVRMRVDGLLRAVPTPAGVLPQALISRIKILAGLNIAERRLPQDGAARVRVGARRVRHPRRHHADAARRVRRDPPAAARPRPARDRQARPLAA